MRVEFEADGEDVVIEEVWVEVKCGACRDKWSKPGYIYKWSGLLKCSDCKGGLQPLNVLPRLSPKDLERLKEECAEHAREHGTEEG